MSAFNRTLEIKFEIDRLVKQTTVQKNTIEVLTTSNATLQNDLSELQSKNNKNKKDIDDIKNNNGNQNNSITSLRNNVDTLLKNNRDSFIKTVTLQGNSGSKPFLKVTAITDNNNSSIMSVKAVATTFTSDTPQTFVFIRTVQFLFNKNTGLLTDANISSHQPNREFRAILDSLENTWTLFFNTNNLLDIKITVLVSFLSDDEMTYSLE